MTFRTWIKWVLGITCNDVHFDTERGQSVFCFMITGHRGRHSDRRISWD